MKKYIYFLVGIFIFFLSLGTYEHVTFNSGKLQVTICDVGQGDAVFIRTPKGTDILFDGGPNDKVLSCLTNSMPFWDRQIDLVVLSHPHADHLNGLVDVFDDYDVGRFVTEELANTTDGYKALEERIKTERVSWETVFAGDRITTPDGVVLKVLSPTKSYVEKTAIDGKYITSTEFASLQVLVTYKDFDLLLTGDSQYQQLGETIAKNTLPSIEVLQEPHHGSRTGITPEIMKKLTPEVVTISVGKNSYGHPSPYVIDILTKEKIPFYRTDKEGNLRLTSDGESYSIN